jgi:hypothetical protein
MSLAFRCDVCDGNPVWTLVRVGDVVTSWACDRDLPEVLMRLQRDYEVTQITVTLHAKAAEWADLDRSLRRIAEEHT